MEKIFRYVVPEGDTRDVGTILKKEFGFNRHEISRLKFQDGLWCDDRKVKVRDCLPSGAVLTIRFRDSVPTYESSGTDVHILYEDEDIVIVNKPSGLPVHPSHGHTEDSLGGRLANHYIALDQSMTLRCIGRLDIEVSGAVLFAKNQPASARLWAQHDKGMLKKTYLAWMEGILTEPCTIEAPIAKAEGYRRMVHPSGQYALSHFTPLQIGGIDGLEYTKVKVSLETGRTHQIRVHSASIDHPLLGDVLYGASSGLIDRVALHCQRIECVSPFTQDLVVVEAPLPEDTLTLEKGLTQMA